MSPLSLKVGDSYRYRDNPHTMELILDEPVRSGSYVVRSSMDDNLCTADLTGPGWERVPDVRAYVHSSDVTTLPVLWHLHVDGVHIASTSATETKCTFLTIAAAVNAQDVS